MRAQASLACKALLAGVTVTGVSHAEDVTDCFQSDAQLIEEALQEEHDSASDEDCDALKDVATTQALCQMSYHEVSCCTRILASAAHVQDMWAMSSNCGAKLQGRCCVHVDCRGRCLCFVNCRLKGTRPLRAEGDTAIAG